MPLYAKFLKDMLSKKKKLDDYETVALTEGYEDLMTKNMNLETQISQLAANQANRPAGTLPSNTEVPRAPGKEHVKAMALRNGKELEGPVPKTFETTPRKEFEPTFKSKSSTPLPTIFEEPEGPSQPIRNTEPIPEPVSISTQATPIGSYHSFKESLEKPPQKAKTTSSPEPSCSTSKPVIKPVPLYVPYPQRLRNQKEELQFKKFLDIFKELHINIPFVEAIEQMPLNLETQISQLAANQANRPAGTLPSNTEVPRAPGKEHVKAMALRNGKELEGPVPKTFETTPRKEFEPTFKSKSSTPLPTIFEEPEGPSQPIRNTEPIPEPVSISTQATPIGSYHSFKESLEKPPQKAKTTSSPEPSCSTSKPVIKPVPLYVPYPQRLRNQKEELQFKKFLDIFKELHINIPFVEAIEQMPLYAKFLKDMLSKKKKLDDYETVALTEGYEDLMTKNMLCGKTIGKALCDLGASINLMPLSVFNSLSIGDVRPTSVTILLADKTIAYPKGKIEDILVQVDKFIFPADFIILDFEADKDIPILLGRPFLATARILIDVQKRELTMRLLDQEITFNMFNSMKYPSGMEDCCELNDIESLCHEEGIEEACKLEEENTEELDLTDETVPMETAAFEILDNTEGKSFTPSIVSPPDLELKQLPAYLKYAFLGDQNKLPVIISSTLEVHQEKKLVEMLKSHTKAIGWTIADLKGISPSVCQHKIILEEKDFTSVEPQRRLNPVMKEVVKKEILKWLDAGIIFPIAGSSWRICMDYRRLNKATQKDHFPLPFIDHMLDRLAGKEYYCFLDGYSGYNQIAIAPENQEKTTFTCPYGTFAFRRMPFGLCNAPTTFQRCMMSIFSDMLEKSIEIFMDDFSVYGSSFDDCLENLRKGLERCEETDLVLNREKCHFMVTEGIVLGHLISKRGVKVDKAKLEVSFSTQDLATKDTYPRGIRYLVHTILLLERRYYISLYTSFEV
ncbi:hypothetical protein OSB04_001079 [Centaurea solstitialis]|uniref:Reverse transcriptase domain-containing protein n=1 Tax=Centaurea solstitialis TaxID=347529 RepID=A0AA38TXT6_9ASTR|nr:hypothetical protein OSB04_001079 [Centaurea solstitialis]